MCKNVTICARSTLLIFIFRVEEIGGAVKTIVDLLEETEDAVVHEKCEKELLKMFTGLPTSHPLVEQVSKQVESSIGSTRWELRMRACTLFGLFSQVRVVTTLLATRRCNWEDIMFLVDLVRCKNCHLTNIIC